MGADFYLVLFLGVLLFHHQKCQQQWLQRISCLDFFSLSVPLLLLALGSLLFFRNLRIFSKKTYTSALIKWWHFYNQTRLATTTFFSFFLHFFGGWLWRKTAVSHERLLERAFCKQKGKLTHIFSHLTFQINNWKLLFFRAVKSRPRRRVIKCWFQEFVQKECHHLALLCEIP